jgi:transcriptional accessory protein Tex/SPT6
MEDLYLPYKKKKKTKADVLVKTDWNRWQKSSWLKK